MIIALPTQAILTANALRNAASALEMSPRDTAVVNDAALALRLHADDLIASAMEHIRRVEAEAALLHSSTRIALAKRGILIPEGAQ